MAEDAELQAYMTAKMHETADAIQAIGKEITSVSQDIKTCNNITLLKTTIDQERDDEGNGRERWIARVLVEVSWVQIILIERPFFSEEIAQAWCGSMKQHFENEEVSLCIMTLHK